MEFRELSALLDIVVDGEEFRVWSAVVELTPAVVVGRRFPEESEPEVFALAAKQAGGYEVSGTVEGWAGVMLEAGGD